MFTTLPKLRRDLVVSEQQHDGRIYFVVKDPLKRRYFRFGEAEHFIASQMDGFTSDQVIRKRVEERFGNPMEAAELETFVETLDRCGFLESTSPQSDRIRSSTEAHFRNPLFLQLKAFDPDPLLNRIIHLFHLFFTPAFLVFSVIVIAAAAGIFAANWPEIRAGFRGLYRFDAFLLGWLVILLVTAAHEFAHALTCKRFGGEVREMGFLLIYFQPAFYCNVSDAWLFPQRSRRLWVTFAGAYFEMLVWGVATLLWRVLEPGSWFSFMALVVMATSWIKTIFNLNPLLKLDGYYLLGDLLGIPNLRYRSFRYLSVRIKSALGLRHEDIEVASAKEAGVYVAYGLLAGVYSYLLLAVVLQYFGSYLVTRFQGWGFVIFTILLMTVFQSSVRRGLRTVIKPTAPSRTSWRRATVVSILVLAIAAMVFVPIEGKISAEFTVLPLQNADVRAEVDGMISRVYVDESDSVTKGAVVATLSDRDFQAELEKISARIDEKKARLRMLRLGTRDEEIELARKAIETARTRMQYTQARFDEAKRMRTERFAKSKASVEKGNEQLKYAASRLESARRLFAQGLMARVEMERAEEEAAVRGRQREEAQAELNLVLADDLSEHQRSLALAGKEHDEAESRLRLLRAGSRPEEKQAVEAEVGSLEAQERHLQQQSRLLQVASPISGVVVTRKPRELAGQHVNRGDLIVNVHEMGTVRAEILTPENEIAAVRIGQAVELKTRAYPREKFFGKVASIQPVAAKNADGFGQRTILVTCRIDNPRLLLKSEMSGKAKIFTGEQRLLTTMTERLVRYVRIEFWSWW